MAKEKSFESELILHRITQDNLCKFDLEFVASEFQYNRLRFDTLAFDENDDSFVIIEYKNEFNANVINQGLDYYNNLSENKKEYLDKYNEVFNTEKTDFNKARVMIIGTEFSDEQINETPDYPYELWKATRSGNDKITYENLTTTESETKTIEVSPEELTITEDDLLKGKNDEICDLYHTLKDRVLSEFDEVDYKIIIDAISFRTHNRIICLANIKSKINVYFFTKDLKDPENKTRDISDITTGGKLSHYEFTFDSIDELDYLITLFKQVYDEKRKSNE